MAATGDQRTFNFTTADLTPPPAVLPRVFGAVFTDANNNGIRDAGEIGLANRQVLIDYNYNGVRDGTDVLVSTDATGNFEIAGIPAGEMEFVVWHEKLKRFETVKAMISPDKPFEKEFKVKADRLK